MKLLNLNYARLKSLQSRVPLAFIEREEKIQFLSELYFLSYLQFRVIERCKLIDSK